MNIKEGDVFRFTCKEEILKNMSLPYYCFDGQLIAMRNGRGELELYDTYWGFRDITGRSFTIKEALEKGKLHYVCNLNEVKEASFDDYKYYNKKDIFNCSYHHGHRPLYFIKKGAKRSKDVMLKYIEKKKQSIRRKIKSLENDLKRLENSKKKIEKGNLNIYL